MPETPLIQAPNFDLIRTEAGIQTSDALQTMWNSIQSQFVSLARQVRNRRASVVLTTIVTGTQNNFDISSANGLDVLLICNNSALLTLTGLAGGYPGQRVAIASIGAGQVDLVHQSGSSDALNRFINFATSGNTSLAAGSGFAEYVNDTFNSRWRLLQHDQGAWITPAYAAGNYTGNGAMTWTVEAGDVTQQAYRLKGRALLVTTFLVTTSVGGTPNTQLRIGNGAWGSFTLAKAQRVVGISYNAGGGGVAAGVNVNPADGTTFITQYTDLTQGTNWSLATNNTSINNQIEFEVT